MGRVRPVWIAIVLLAVVAAVWKRKEITDYLESPRQALSAEIQSLRTEGTAAARKDESEPVASAREQVPEKDERMERLSRAVEEMKKGILALDGYLRESAERTSALEREMVALREAPGRPREAFADIPDPEAEARIAEIRRQYVHSTLEDLRSFLSQFSGNDDKLKAMQLLLPRVFDRIPDASAGTGEGRRNGEDGRALP